jgi:S1-C subfamily serine protease
MLRPAALAAALLMASAPARGLEKPDRVAAATPPAEVIVYEAHEIEKQIIRCAAVVQPAFVFIGGGSGVVISADGYMLTNHHVAGQSRSWKVRLAGEKTYRSAKVTGYDPLGDLSLLKIEGEKFSYVELGDSDKLKVGTHVVAVGNPFGLAEVLGQPTVSFGIVSAVKSFQENYSDAIWTDAAVNPGNSGGPLLTLDGKLVGINGRIEPRFMTRSNTGIGYAISANQIKRFLPCLMKAEGRRVLHGRVEGLALENPPADRSASPFTYPAIVREVKPKSSAAKAGFQAGDCVVGMGDQEIFNIARYGSVLGAYPAGSELTFKVKRKVGTAEKVLPIRLTLDSARIPLNPGFSAQGIKLPNGVTALVVTAVQRGSSADKAGLRPGDVVTTVDGRTLDREENLRAFVEDLQNKYKAGDVLELTVRRPPKGEEQKPKITLVEAF